MSQIEDINTYQTNNFIKSVALLTYSHSSYKDVLEIYFLQLTKYFPQINGYLLIDKIPFDIPSNHKIVYYDDNVYYYKHILNALITIKEEYIIYMQEDFILFDEPDFNILNQSLTKLSLNNIDFIRLIRSGDLKNLTTESFHNIPNKSKSLFSMQATLWKKSTLLKLFSIAYEKYKTDNIWESEIRLNKLSQNLNLKGLFIYRNEHKRGKNHWDSNVFPYLATAVVKGNWNYKEYKKELLNIFSINDIMPKRKSNENNFFLRIITYLQLKFFLLLYKIKP